MIISQIVAISANFVIAKNNKLPWDLPADMEYFKNVTWGHHVLMGRKNYEAEGKLLEGRINIIITRKSNYNVPGAYIFSNVEDGIDAARKAGEKELFVVGGGQIYRQTLKYTDRLYLTVIHNEFQGDTFYKEFQNEHWETISQITYKADQKNPIDHTYYVMEKI